VQYHEVILEAIRHRDPDRAEATLKSHILEYGERVAGNFEALHPEEAPAP
jgi:DNA-binding GntR family transcriptional regulator